MDFQEINDKTGFANGDEFETEKQAREYFTVENMHVMFGSDYEIEQELLNEMAERVIDNQWHCDFKIKTENVTVRMTKKMYDFLLNEAKGIERDISKVIREFIDERMAKNTLHWIVKFHNAEQLADFVCDEEYKEHFYALSNFALLNSKQTIYYTNE